MPGPEPRRGFEPWAYGAFAIAAATCGLFVYLGLRPGGRGPILTYTFGPLLVGTAAALLMAGALLWSLLRRPLLQRKRLTPLVVLAACLWLCSFPIAYPSSHEGHPSAVAFRLPFEGAWRVRWGGTLRTDNRYVLDPARCFGYAFEPGDLAPSRRVLAPAAGRVKMVGPFVALEVAPTETLLLEGVEASVAPGGHVEAGQPLGELSAAYLTVYLRDGHLPGAGEGIPMLFLDYQADGRPVERGVPRRGQVVAAEAGGR